MTRRTWGMSDYERREYDQRRRTRNCLIVIWALVMICGIIAAN